jgi:hypothetical protein
MPNHLDCLVLHDVGNSRSSLSLFRDHFPDVFYRLFQIINIAFPRSISIRASRTGVLCLTHKIKQFTVVKQGIEFLQALPNSFDSRLK